VVVHSLCMQMSLCATSKKIGGRWWPAPLQPSRPQSREHPRKTRENQGMPNACQLSTSSQYHRYEFCHTSNTSSRKINDNGLIIILGLNYNISEVYSHKCSTYGSIKKIIRLQNDRQQDRINRHFWKNWTEPELCIVKFKDFFWTPQNSCLEIQVLGMEVPHWSPGEKLR